MPAGGAPELGAALPNAAARRAILVSFDSFNERRTRETVPEYATAALRTLFDSSACASYSRTAFPSITAPAHASLWTGAYGDVNGITANDQPWLPRDRHTLLELTSGFGAAALRAEPLWIAAARAGRTVVAHHTTQTPDAPGYPPITLARPDSLATLTRPDSLAAARERALQALRLPGLLALNGYNRRIAPDTVLDERSAPPHEPGAWQGLGRLRSALPPREIAWRVGADSLFGLLYGEGREYTRLLVAPVRDVARGVVVEPAAADTAPMRGRELARYFSSPLPLGTGAARIYARVRLFALSGDGARYLLFQPALAVIDANQPEAAAAYLAAIGGWTGNTASRLYTRGSFGPTALSGGDGTAEARYAESMEYLTRQGMRGAAWAWRTRQPALLLDYFPLLDDVDAMTYGLVSPEAPGYEARRAAALQALRARAYALAGLRLDSLRSLVAGDSAAALFVASDHGMRATYRVFRVNVALQRAGLLAVDSTGRIDLSRTRALSPNGSWVMLNRTAWKGGTVPPAEEAATLAAAERALTAVRDSAGAPIVTRIWRAAADDSLGLGGPAGGDIYYGLAPGYRPVAAPTGEVASAGVPLGTHGFPSTDADMYTVFCAAGAAFQPRRTGPVRTVDVAPTVAEWLGVPSPADSRGRSRLGALLRAGPSVPRRGAPGEER